MGSGLGNQQGGWILGRVHDGARLRAMRKATLLFCGVYVAFLAGTMAYRSAHKSSASVFRNSPQSPETAGPASKLHLQDFYQVRMKGGRESYEIKARDAKYFAQEGVTYVLKVELTLPRKDGSEVKIFSDSARLFMENETLNRAELEGNVVVNNGASMTLKTDFATFDSGEQLITAPRAVDVTGPGYSIKGIGMDLELDSESVTLHREVKSQFERGTEMPSILPRANNESRGKKNLSDQRQ